MNATQKATMGNAENGLKLGLGPRRRRFKSCRSDHFSLLLATRQISRRRIALQTLAAGDLRMRCAEVLVLEIEEDFPILSGHRMFAGTNVIAECAVEEFA